MRGLGDAIERAVKPIARIIKKNCLEPSGRLKAESPCAKRRDKLNRLVPFKQKAAVVILALWAASGLAQLSSIDLVNLPWPTNAPAATNATPYWLSNTMPTSIQVWQFEQASQTNFQLIQQQLNLMSGGLSFTQRVILWDSSIATNIYSNGVMVATTDPDAIPIPPTAEDLLDDQGVNITDDEGTRIELFL